MEIGAAVQRGGVAWRLTGWIGANIVPIVLIPLAGVFVWVAIWRVWLPQPGGGPPVTRAETTVDANAGTRPTHKVTTVVKTAAGAVPSRRSETLVIAFLFLGAGMAVIAVFNNRIAGIELDKDGVKITLNRAEKAGAAELVDRLARNGAGSRALGRSLRRYLRSVAAQRTESGRGKPPDADPEPARTGLTIAEAHALATRIADDLD